MECAYYYVDGTWNVPTTMNFVGCVSQTFADGLYHMRRVRPRGLASGNPGSSISLSKGSIGTFLINSEAGRSKPRSIEHRVEFRHSE
jgi:hypothetical protein